MVISVDERNICAYDGTIREDLDYMSDVQTKYPLSPTKIIKKTMVDAFAWSIFLGSLLVGLGILSLTVDASLQALVFAGLIGLVILWLVVIVLSYLYQVWYFNTYFYDFATDYLVIKKGPITPREITIPYERIQDVYVDQDLLDRLLGLYDVHLSSATVSSGMEAHIDGVEKPAADGLRAALLKTVSERISKKS